MDNDIAYLDECIAIKRMIPTLPDIELITNTDDLLSLIKI
jgi:hypothetical protein